MKRILMTALAAMLASISTTNLRAADNDSATVTLTTTVADTCYISNPSFTGISFGASEINADTALLTDGTTATQSITDVYCNFAGTTVTVSSPAAGMRNTSASTILSGDFAGDNSTSGVSILPYTAKAQWNTISATYDSDSGANATAAVSGANRADLSITVTMDNQKDPLLAGTYTDTVTVAIAPTGP